LRLGLVAVVVPFIVAACGGGNGATHVLVYQKPVTFDGWGWIWRAAPDGSHPRKLVLGYDPSVSPDGRLVAYRHAGSMQKLTAGPPPHRDSLWVIPSSGDGKPRKIGKNQLRVWILGWAPHSKHVLISDDNGLENVDTGGGTMTPLARGEVYAASFSPDGRRIAYERDTKDGSDIFVVS